MSIFYKMIDTLNYVQLIKKIFIIMDNDIQMLCQIILYNCYSYLFILYVYDKIYFVYEIFLLYLYLNLISVFIII